MLYEIDKRILNTEGFSFLNIEGCEYYWKGLFWLFDCKQGEESVYAFEKLYKENPTKAYGKMFGSFCMIRKEGNEIRLFTDNSNMNTLFISDKYISHSFLEMVRNHTELNYDKKAIVEYFETGTTYDEKTVFSEIKQLHTDDVININGEKITLEKKKIKDIDADGDFILPEVFFEKLAYALDGKKTALSLTGGYDSRLVFAVLYKNLKLDTVLSGDNIDNKEFMIAKKLSKIAKVRHKDIIITKPQISEEILHDLFVKEDGVLFEMQDGDIRLSQYKDELEKLKYEVLITGDTGTYHKDWYWLSDFPLYHKKKFSISKYIRQRLIVIDRNIPYGKELKREKNAFFNNMEMSLKKIRKDINTRSYDMFSWKLKYPTKCRYNHLCNGYDFQIYSPLNERELIRYSYALPRRKRFFYNEMRAITTKASPKIARVATNYGTNESSELLYVIKDIFVQFIDYAKKAIRLFGRKFLKKTFFVTHPTTWTCKDEVLHTKLADDAISWAVANKWLTKDANAQNMDFGTLGKIMRLYLLDKEMR